MAFLRLIVLYTALALCANTAVADTAALEALREGHMKKLMFHADPAEVSDVAFVDESGAEMTLADLRGRHVLVNFWATWCAPCRKEMPSLNALQTELGGDAFRVVTIATGGSKTPAIRRFFEEVGADALPQYRDPKQALARAMGIFGLPISIILDPEGREIARLRGDAEWDNDSAKAIIRALTAPPG